MFASTGLALGLYFSIQNDQRRWVVISPATQTSVPAVFDPNYSGNTLFRNFTPNILADTKQNKGQK